MRSTPFVLVVLFMLGAGCATQPVPEGGPPTQTVFTNPEGTTTTSPLPTSFDPESTCGSIGCPRDCSDAEPCWFTFEVWNRGTSSIGGSANLTFQDETMDNQTVTFVELLPGKRVGDTIRVWPTNATSAIVLANGTQESAHWFTVDWWTMDAVWEVDDAGASLARGVI